VIEINLLPGAAKRSRKKLSLGLPAGLKPSGNGPALDKWAAYVVGAWIVGPVLVGWLFLGSRSRMDELNTAIEGARLDSTRYAEIRAANATMQARQDTIAQKLQIIQEIDAGRYIWAHIMDEMSRALPQYTWLSNVLYITNDAGLQSPRFSIEGRTGNTFALTQFMQNLEASPFLRSITLVTTDQIRDQDKLIYSFFLEGQYEEPPPEMIRTVPLFGTREGF
jgi:type IV pilus assembly protein PilN